MRKDYSYSWFYDGVVGLKDAGYIEGLEACVVDDPRYDEAVALFRENAFKKNPAKEQLYKRRGVKAFIRDKDDIDGYAKRQKALDTFNTLIKEGVPNVIGNLTLLSIMDTEFLDMVEIAEDWLDIKTLTKEDKLYLALMRVYGVTWSNDMSKHIKLIEPLVEQGDRMAIELSALLYTQWGTRDYEEQILDLATKGYNLGSLMCADILYQYYYPRRKSPEFSGMYLKLRHELYLNGLEVDSDDAIIESGALKKFKLEKKFNSGKELSLEERFKVLLEARGNFSTESYIELIHDCCQYDSEIFDPYLGLKLCDEAIAKYDKRVKERNITPYDSEHNFIEDIKKIRKNFRRVLKN